MQDFRHNDFAIGCPDGWLDVSTVVLAGPPDGEFSPNITVTCEPLEEPLSCARYAEQQLPALREEFGEMGYKVKIEGPIKLGDLECHQRIHTFGMPESQMELQQWQVYVVVGDRAFTVTSTDKLQTFDRNFPLFRQAVAQLKFLKP